MMSATFTSPAFVAVPMQGKHTARQACAARPVRAARRITVTAQTIDTRDASAGTVGRRDAILKAGAVAAISLAVVAPALAGAPAGPAIGDKAPDFKLPSTTGKDLALGDFTGKNWTVLYFYNQDFTTGCSLEATRFEQALPDFKAAKAQVVGVSMDAMEKHTEFCSKKGLTFPLLSDNAGTVSAAYGADLSIPFLGKFSDRQTFLIDPAGVVRARWLERDGSMADVKSPAHAQQILSRIKELA